MPAEVPKRVGELTEARGRLFWFLACQISIFKRYAVFLAV